MSKEIELLVIEGPLKGRRFAVPADGLRLGRSSSCEISIPDPALSRNHCLFETRDGGLWVTDLASANGTAVNDVQLGPDSHCLRAGDRVCVGDSVIQALAAGETAAEPPVAASPALPKIDLGLGGDGPHPGEAAAPAQPSRLRFVLWGVALVSVLGALALMLLPVSSAPEAQAKPLADDEGELVSFTFEKVEANTGAISRCAFTYKDRQLSTEIDDLSETKRHVKKTVELRDDARARLSEILSTAKLRDFAPEYQGTPSVPGSLQSFRLHVVRSVRAFDVSIENKAAPEAFQDVCSQLETFAMSELGIWAILSSPKELLEKSAEARFLASRAWDERGETNYEKYDEALKRYEESLQYLETLDPKPAEYEQIRTRRATVRDEIDRVYRRLRGNADQAVGTQNWRQARKELQDILKLVPDANDERNKDARRKLLEVDARDSRHK